MLFIRNFKIEVFIMLGVMQDAVLLLYFVSFISSSKFGKMCHKVLLQHLFEFTTVQMSRIVKVVHFKHKTYLIIRITCKNTGTQNKFTAKLIFHQSPTTHLRLLIWCFILVGSAMFGATFNLVTRVGLP